MKRECGNCALKAIKGGMCPIFNADMSGEGGCPYFTTELYTCDICGTIIPKGGVIEEEESIYHLLCGNCANADPCAVCVQVKQCRFQTDQSCPEPPMIMVQRRQGNMVVQTQQLNPKRVQATCAQGCPCFNEEGLDDGTFCIKQNGCGCKNYKTNWRN